ncbi:MAG: sulfite exporter TauE/SafE family protein [Oscillospiraceae bacterium]|jgi:uncharacterized membrane protein YfcA|nr:sulfite exporter TauE/SafE family protein [Oscillospiraceae bacterium]
MSDIKCIIPAILAGMFAAMGVGGNGILIVYLTIFTGVSQRTSQGISLLFFIPVATIAISIYVKKKLISYKTAIPLVVSGVAGTFWGFYIGNFVDQVLLSKIFGAVFILMGISQWFDNKNSKKDAKK